MATNFPPRTVELIIYIASKLGNKPNYGSTLLGKALYFIDCLSYVKTGKPISDFTYIKQKNGPTPDPRKFLPIREYLVTNGELDRVEANYFGRIQYKFLAKRGPEIGNFSKEEIFLIDEVLDSICDQNATQVSEQTHQIDCWIVAEEKEELPFHSFLLNHQEPSPETRAWAEAFARKHLEGASSHNEEHKTGI